MGLIFKKAENYPKRNCLVVFYRYSIVLAGVRTRGDIVLKETPRLALHDLLLAFLVVVQ